jgi:YVTN family beta-propeller protein
MTTGRGALLSLGWLVAVSPVAAPAEAATLYVTNTRSDSISVIDVKTHRQVKAIPVGKAPHGMALRPR